MTIRKGMLFAVLLLFSTAAMAQRTDQRPALRLNVEGLNVKGGVHLASSYLWRGTQLADISLQPYGTIEWKGLKLGASSNLPIHEDVQKEIRMKISYTLFGVNIGLTDYWHSNIDERDRFFYYKNEDGPHKLEANLGYSNKWFSLQAYMFFYGDDFKPTIKEKQRAYSTFIEAAVPFSIGGVDLNATIGISPTKSAGYYTVKLSDDPKEIRPIIQAEYFYSGSFAVVEAALRATKNFSTSDRFSIPAYVELHTNPYLKTAHMMCGVGLEF
jgi:hypothetical protein